MVEPEMAYADLNDVMDLAEDLIVSIVGRVLEHRRRELKVLERDLSKLESVQKPFPRISYDEAVKTLQAKDCRSNGAATSAASTRRRSPRRTIAR